MARMITQPVVQVEQVLSVGELLQVDPFYQDERILTRIMLGGDWVDIPEGSVVQVSTNLPVHRAGPDMSVPPIVPDEPYEPVEPDALVERIAQIREDFGHKGIIKMILGVIEGQVSQKELAAHFKKICL